MDDITKHTNQLDDLIWQGSEISTGVKCFPKDDLKTTLKSLDHQWKSCQKETQERLTALESARVGMVGKENLFHEVLLRVGDAWETVNQERTMKERTRGRLEKCLQNYEVKLSSLYA